MRVYQILSYILFEVGFNYSLSSGGNASARESFASKLGWSVDEPNAIAM